MGNKLQIASISASSNRDGGLIQVHTDLYKLTQYGHPVPEQKNTTNTSNNSFTLQDLYPYITYSGSINRVLSSLTLLEHIANIISIYAGIKNTINKSFSFKVHVDKKKKSLSNNSLSIKPYHNYIANDEFDGIFTSILCGCSWNGIVYLITPINHQTINANLYMIDGGYFAPNSKQHSLKFEFQSSKYSLDPNLCCVVSHIVSNSNNTQNNHYYNQNPRSCMIIDGIILVNSQSDTIYGYHMVNNNKGLFVLKQFHSTTTTTMTHDYDTDYNIISVDKNETIINLWRQNIDAFVLTSKFNLYGIRIEQNSFRIAKICCFKQALVDIKDIEKYTNCWYDINNKILFLVYKNINNNSVQFKMYESDRIYKDYNEEEDECDGTVVWDKYSDASSIELEIPKSLEFILDNTYTKYNKSVLFYHKPSDTLLLFFGVYLIQISIDFKMKILTTVNVGMIQKLDCEDNQTYDADTQLQEIKRDLMRLNNERVANHLMVNFESTQNISMNSELIDAKPLPAESTVTDHIIGYDEFRSCIILNFNQYQKELSTLYKFEVNIMRATDFASDWKKLLPFELR